MTYNPKTSTKFIDGVIFDLDPYSSLRIGIYTFTPANLKRIHKWLGQAIAYLESKESPKDGAAGKGVRDEK